MSSTNEQPTVTDTLLSGMLALLIAERDERGSDDANSRKTEVILADAGLSPQQIARLMGKNVDAVRKTIQRAK